MPGGVWLVRGGCARRRNVNLARGRPRRRRVSSVGVRAKRPEQPLGVRQARADRDEGGRVSGTNFGWMGTRNLDTKMSTSRSCSLACLCATVICRSGTIFVI